MRIRQDPTQSWEHPQSVILSYVISVRGTGIQSSHHRNLLGLGISHNPKPFCERKAFGMAIVCANAYVLHVLYMHLYTRG